MHTPLNFMRIRRQNPMHTFGMVRKHGRKPHQGWDLRARVGTPVYAVATGTIRDIRHQGKYGLQITLRFQNGARTLYAFYAHLSSVACAEGEQVAEGALLGYTGKTGNAAGQPAADDHLHFEIRTQLHPPRGLVGRMDPGELLGYQYYSSAP